MKNIFVKKRYVFKPWKHVLACKCGWRSMFSVNDHHDPCPKCGCNMHKMIGRWQGMETSYFFGIYKTFTGKIVLRAEVSNVENTV